MTRYILAIDPGKATGASFFSFEKGGEPILLASWELTFDNFAETVRSCLYHYPHTEVVCETFTITAATAKNSQAPFSLEHIGILKQCMVDADQDVKNLIFQSPSDAKKMFDNPKLKKLGFWHKGGAGHANDSIRHGLLHLVKTGWMPRGLL